MRRQNILIIVLASLFALLLVAYIFLIRPMEKENEAGEETSAVETEDGESLGISDRYFLFSSLERKDIKSIEVDNEYGGFTLTSDKDGDFHIKGFEHLNVDPEKLSSLVSVSTYTLAKTKVGSSLSDEKLLEYGLKTPQASWIVTDKDGNRFRVFVGDKLLTGGGYYCMFDGRRSVYVLGTEVEEMLEAIEKDIPYGGREKELIRVGVHVLPKFPRDTTDRNRTSPFAFTGNKFEFRMLGSSASISGVNVVINTAVAESLRQYADALEGSRCFEEDLHELIKYVLKKHRRIIFNGNGYDAAWIEEAEKRGLLNLHATPDCVPYYLAEKNVELFTRHGVYTETEMNARCSIKLDSYCKLLRIESEVMLTMVRRDILPAVSAYSKSLSDAALSKRALDPELDVSFETELVKRICDLTAKTVGLSAELENALHEAGEPEDALACARCFEYSVLPAMEKLRTVVDELETCTAKEAWPYPSIGDILFSVK